MNIALGLIEQDGEYLLQYRNGAESIGAAGLTGCFGGKIEDNEKPAEAVAREISEETSLKTTAADWERLGAVDVLSDYRQQPVEVHAEVFRIVVEPRVGVVATEGELVRVKLDLEGYDRSSLTPATKALFNELVL